VRDPRDAGTVVLAVVVELVEPFGATVALPLGTVRGVDHDEVERLGDESGEDVLSLGVVNGGPLTLVQHAHRAVTCMFAS
jgi:hypothetical protein